MQCEFQEGTIFLLLNLEKSTEQGFTFARNGESRNSLDSYFLQLSQIYRSATSSDARTQIILCQKERKQVLSR